ncbi:MAG: chromosome segregation protein SMC [Pseudomonadota bacterium]
MQIKGLRLIGFKSFVEPTDLIIEPGLTGVVGPNGCGKSNLLEALRWVMGETSYKSMRASSMDDVIFSGTDHRPARNAAEVMISLDNTSRSAPAEFNDSDTIEITRRIEREAGSVYRVNGKEVRARDVKVLFEDAATGARSHALVRQGQIGELITAKPEKRRRILEDAAGIAGLHTRRHEAEIKLRAADGNLERMDDLLGQLNGQINGLKRQARQAKRYKEIAGEIREAEAILLHLGWCDVSAAVTGIENGLDGVVRALAEATEAESAAQRAQFEANRALQPLRDREAERAAALQRLKIENENLSEEHERAATRQAELASVAEQLANDLTREASMVAEAEAEIARLSQDRDALLASADDDAAAEKKADLACLQADEELGAVEADLATQRAALAEAEAERKAYAGRVREAETRRERLIRERDDLQRQRDDASASAPELATAAALSTQIDAEADALASLEREATDAEENAAQAREAEREAADAHGAQRERLNTRTAERDALVRTLGPEQDDAEQTASDAVSVTPGYEAALAAALGDDLDAALVADAHRERDGETFWRTDLDAVPGPELPADATPLATVVDVPPALIRRLSQVGLVDESVGAECQQYLSSGQRLVSREGSLWRWDGYVMRAGAQTPAARRLAARNRIEELNREIADATTALERARKVSERATQASKQAQQEDITCRNALREAQRTLAARRDELARLEKIGQQSRERLAKTSAQLERLVTECEDAEHAAEKIQAAAPDDTVGVELQAKVEALLAHVTEARETAVTRRTDAARAKALRADRASQIAQQATEIARWNDRQESAAGQTAKLKARAEKNAADIEVLRAVPDEIAARQERLRSEITRAEQARKDAADKLALADTSLRKADATLRAAQSAVADGREERARMEAQRDAARERMAEHGRLIRETLKCMPDQCLQHAGAVDPDNLPERDKLTRTVERLKADRERLGGVNLRAEEELDEVTAQFESMETERTDLEEAIAKLRQGISQLNREARRRLLDAFEKVDGHFQRLFSTLFNGGEARLKLVDSDDPLDAGLEIVARPPGKKPNTLSLLSGGEQALTATALTFAVFLTNPSPICVLDEVDAPLDDANVDRYCNLMEEMARSTDTRFLVITHHPNTMARMARLFGVTMMEKGISQLVSVDLETAEQIRDAASSA